MSFLVRKKKDIKILDFLGNKVSIRGNRNDIYTSTAIKICYCASSLGYIYVVVKCSDLRLK